MKKQHKRKYKKTKMYIYNWNNKFDIYNYDIYALLGNLKIIKWLHYTRKEYLLNKTAMNLAAEYGHLNIIKFLYKYDYTCTQYAMYNARENGHLEVVKWLLNFWKKE